MLARVLPPQARFPDPAAFPVGEAVPVHYLGLSRLRPQPNTKRVE